MSTWPALLYGIFAIALIVGITTVTWRVSHPTRPTDPPEPPIPRPPADDDTRLLTRRIGRPIVRPGMTMDPRWRPDPVVQLPDQPATPPTSARYHCPGCQCDNP